MTAFLSVRRDGEHPDRLGILGKPGSLAFKIGRRLPISGPMP
jgi:hypothetical protein